MAAEPNPPSARSHRSCLLAAACAACPVDVPVSPAILEARARADNRAGQAVAMCERLRAAQPGTLQLPFGYADAGLTKSARGALQGAVAWLACVPEGLAVLQVETEHHYRNPALEADLQARRLQAVRDHLGEAGVATARLRAAPAEAQPFVALRLYGRGW